MTIGKEIVDARETLERGVGLLQQRRFVEAVDAFDRVVESSPAYAPAHFYAGVALFSLGRVVEAAACYEAAVHYQPRMFEAHNNLGIALQVLGKIDAALACHDRALEIAPNVADVHNSRGNCLIWLQRPTEARAAFARCLELDSHHAQALNNEAIFLHRDNRHAESLDYYERAVEIARAGGVDFDDARYNRGLLLLTLGDFERGWIDYESRLPSLPLPSASEVALLQADLSEGGDGVGMLLRAEAWHDQASMLDLDGKIVYVRAEQGYGDTLQFVRYLPMLRKLGARVVFECQPGMKTLLDPSPRPFPAKGGEQEVISAEYENLCDEIVERGAGNGLLAAPEGAYSIFVQSLPYFFGTDFTNIPADVPYLHAPEDRIEKWRKIVKVADPDRSTRVGIVWGGNQSDLYNRFRSCVLADFAPLADVEGIHFFSLQKGPHAVQAMSPPPGMRLTHLGDDLVDFADTAAAMEQMDVIVTIDTSMAHLAGALGKPTWTLLLWSADWRWFIDRADSPWYPSMRLFRQPFAGAWGPVFDDVAKELRAL